MDVEVHLHPEVLPSPAPDPLPDSADEKEDQHHVLLHPLCLPVLLVQLSFPHQARAASIDLKMFQDVSTFRIVNRGVSDACIPVLQRHTWYITKDSIPIALFNPDLDSEAADLLAVQCTDQKTCPTSDHSFQ